MRLARTVLFTIALSMLAWSAAADTPHHRVPFTDDELIAGFSLTVFGAEADLQGGRPGSRIVKKFTGPVYYHIISTSMVDRRDTTRAFVEALGASVQNLVMIETSTLENANMVIYLVDRSRYIGTIRETVWSGVDGGFLEGNACSAVIAARPTGIERAQIYIVADEGFLGLSHCLVEEIAQSLGPANDSPLLTDSIFNDDSDLNVFALFDWFILNMLYDRRIEAGMTEAEARPLLPEVITHVRSIVGQLFTHDDPRIARGDEPLH
ncbi:DUF2927 domain-containing protein [Acuticoccus sp. M5D2P5]|uniref:DUF2927 domain-containing protein n=1 Tax=Acuticoccus kalidii TaxID=2910977 RepID=UPI001F1AF3C3|nr:DUF2927 domain-containing protein [Acuticoccus kalidii]MCF3932201.1 DUF2927 domain-containing protein [Acuticoccus kalidii]